MTRDELSTLLSEAMAGKGWKITDLAEAAELAYETVRSAVRGQTSPSLENAEKMLRAVGLQLTTEPVAVGDVTPPTPALASA